MNESTRQFIRTRIVAGDNNAQILAAVAQLPPTPKASSPATYVTYTSISVDTGRFGAGAINLAGEMRQTLKVWTTAADLSQINPALPNPGALETIHDRLAGATGLDLSNEQAPALITLFATGVDPTHPPLMSMEQGMLLLSIGYDLPSATEEEIDIERRQIESEASLAPVRDAWNAFNAAMGEWTMNGGTKPVFTDYL